MVFGVTAGTRKARHRRPTAHVRARYRCFLPDLAGLAGTRRAGPMPDNFYLIRTSDWNSVTGLQTSRLESVPSQNRKPFRGGNVELTELPPCHSGQIRNTFRNSGRYCGPKIAIILAK